MPKWLPKVMKNGPKWSPGAPRIDLLFVFIDFRRRRKNLIFRWGSGATKKQRKSTRRAPKAWKKLPRRQRVSVKSPGGSRHSRLGIKRPTTSRWSHTPMGRRPGEFYVDSYWLIFFCILKSIQKRWPAANDLFSSFWCHLSIWDVILTLAGFWMGSPKHVFWKVDETIVFVHKICQLPCCFLSPSKNLFLLIVV